jgi:hypothetical protein
MHYIFLLFVGEAAKKDSKKNVNDVFDTKKW